MRTLLFQNNVHNVEKIEIPGEEEPRAINLTVRKGQKWNVLKTGDVVELLETPPDPAEVDAGNVTSSPVEPQLATIYDVKVMVFADLIHYGHLLKLHHDPACQNYPGLFKTMRHIYDGFLQHELVTLVLYELKVN